MKEFMIGNFGILPTDNVVSQRAKALSGGAAGKDALERKRAAEEFASYLYLEVLKAMRATLPKGGIFESDSLSRDIYTSMFDTEVARVLAKRDATGFTKTVERSIDFIAHKPSTEVYRAPVEGVVSSSFGMRYDPIHGENRFHKGVDIAAPAGVEVKAPLGGRVIFSGPAQGYGNLVEIDHGDGTVTRYAHNAANLVAVGDEVQAGQAIATVGSTGRATGSHLHFEVIRWGKPVDPAAIIGSSGKGTKLSSVI